MITPLSHTAATLPLQQIQFKYGLIKQGGLNTTLQPLRIYSLIACSFCFITCWTSLDMEHRIFLLQILCLFSGPQGTVPESLRGIIPDYSTLCVTEMGERVRITNGNLFSCLFCRISCFPGGRLALPTSCYPACPGKQEQQVHSSFSPSFCHALKHF